MPSPCDQATSEPPTSCPAGMKLMICVEKNTTVNQYACAPTGSDTHYYTHCKLSSGYSMNMP